MKLAKLLALCVACHFAAPVLAQTADANSPTTASSAPASIAPPAGALPDGPRGFPPPPGAGFADRGPHHGGPGFEGRPEGPPEVHAAIRTIDEIASLYVETDRASELPAFYRSVLAKTHDPIIRDLVFHRLADTQLKPAHADDAIATLRGALDESLARLDSLPHGGPKH
ncbi:hypothetical protein [Pararobbsia silviterrae]|uniref:Uncharacterized protein n=1 Tax=Pararobbsia silviterrae TaxID=1792498 RepID=A0A494XD35_9BURK|nr:hypothetical protein [Pararobbsia silviterrae]RKP48665.1 hypothetical protein D7S86_21945 [Pararobbsia silviterrae]